MRGRAEKANGSDTEQRREKGSGELLCEKEQRRQLRKEVHLQITLIPRVTLSHRIFAGPNRTVAARRDERGGLALVLN